MKPKVIALTKDEHPQVRKAALKCLKKYWQGDADLMAIYEDALKDSSYNVMAQAIDALAEIDKDRAMDIARKYEKEKGAVSNAISRIYAKYGGKEEHAYFLLKLDETSGFNKYGMLQLYNNYLMRQDESEISKGLEIFEEVARNGSPWFLKLSGYQLLQNAVAQRLRLRRGPPAGVQLVELVRRARLRLQNHPKLSPNGAKSAPKIAPRAPKGPPHRL